MDAQLTVLSSLVHVNVSLTTSDFISGSTQVNCTLLKDLERDLQTACYHLQNVNATMITFFLAYSCHESRE